MTTSTDYEGRAKQIAEALGLAVTIMPGPDKCPGWVDDEAKPSHRGCPRCGTIHGRNYWVTITRTSILGRRRALSFDFWGSWADANRLFQKVKHPSVYDILSCVASDAAMPTNPDEVVEEMGEMKPSQATAIAQHAAKLQKFFTRDEIEKLGEVDR